MTIYCTYLTVYSGSKLPPFYIGSSSVSRIESGYRGTVSSKIYKDIWNKELKENPHLFKTRVLTKHNTRKEAIDRELSFQKALSVVTSTLYINMAYATVDGFFGVSQKGLPKRESMRKKSIGNKNAKGNTKNKSEEHKIKIKNALTGKIRSVEHSNSISNAKKGGHWWNDGEGNTTMSRQCPGEGWFRGRVYSSSS